MKTFEQTDTTLNGTKSSLRLWPNLLKFEKAEIIFSTGIQFKQCVVSFTVPAQQTPSPKGSCARAGYVSHGTSCYKFVKTPVQSWQMAENFCQGDGGVLASINNIYENSFIESQMGPNFDYWIGLQYNKVNMGTYT